MRAYGRGRTWLLRRHPNAVSPLFLLPPLIITEADLKEAIDRLDAACAAIEAEQKNASQPGATQ